MTNRTSYTSYFVDVSTHVRSTKNWCTPILIIPLKWFVEKDLVLSCTVRKGSLCLWNGGIITKRPVWHDFECVVCITDFWTRDINLWMRGSWQWKNNGTRFIKATRHGVKVVDIWSITNHTITQLWVFRKFTTVFTGWVQSIKKNYNYLQLIWFLFRDTVFLMVYDQLLSDLVLR